MKKESKRGDEYDTTHKIEKKRDRQATYQKNRQQMDKKIDELETKGSRIP